MKRFWRIVSIALICGALAAPQLDARGRNNTTNSNQRTMSSRPTANSNNRPGGSSSQRPGGNNNAPKPGGNNSRPGGSSSQRPGGNNNAPKPGGNNHRPSQPAPRPGNRPTPRPNHSTPPPAHHAPHHNHVHRPHCPPPAPYHRPVPPPSYRPYSGCPVLRGVFGITFGTAINISLDYLRRNSYTVYGYGNDVIYLRNVNQYGYMWPDATLYYGVGGLTGSQFMFSTNYHDRARYNMVYNTLVNQYGAPISVQNTSNGIIATWWGYDNQYVSLQYEPSYTSNGQLRYFTTLSFGI